MKNKYIVNLCYDSEYFFNHLEEDLVGTVHDVDSWKEHYGNDDYFAWMPTIGESLEDLAEEVAKSFKAIESGSSMGFGVRDLSYMGFKSIQEAILFTEYLEDVTEGKLMLESISRPIL